MILVLVVAMAATTLSTVRERDAAISDLEQRVEPARMAVNDLLSAMTDQETGVRGFLLTHQPEFLEPYTAGRQATDRSLQQLQTQIGDDPAFATRVTAIAAAARAWQVEVAEVEVALARRGRIDQAIDMVPSGRARFDTFRQEATSLRQALLAVQTTAAARAHPAHDV